MTRIHISLEDFLFRIATKDTLTRRHRAILFKALPAETNV
jgi:hypothetical protein